MRATSCHCFTFSKKEYIINGFPFSVCISSSTKWGLKPVPLWGHLAGSVCRTCGSSSQGPEFKLHVKKKKEKNKPPHSHPLAQNPVLLRTARIR